MQTERTRRSWVEYLLPVLALAVLLLYTYARFFVAPYLGFQYSPGNGEIIGLFTTEAAGQLQLGDLIQEANGVTIEEYSASLTTSLFSELRAGEAIHLRVERAGAAHSVELRAPGFNVPEFMARLINTWWLSYAFWLTGTITLLQVRPKDLRWLLLIGFCYITAIWLVSGSLSTTGVYSSPLVFRMGIWISLPIYLHLHWNFPRPWRRLPAAIWGGLYAVSVVMAAAQGLNLLPRSLYLLPLAAAIGGSLIFLLLRLAGKREERAQVRLLLIASAVGLLPVVVLGFSSTAGGLSAFAAGSLVSLLAWPGAYLYVVYRNQLRGLELRANRLISLYLFFVLLFTVSLVLVPLLSPRLQSPNEVATAILATGFLVSLFSVFAFRRFQHFVERRLLRIPMPPEELASRFLSRISTSYTRENLAHTLQDEVLPPLLIRQSALLQVGAPSPASRILYLQGVSPEDLPGEQMQRAMLASPPGEASAPTPGTWVQMHFPLFVGGHPAGLWLLGRKDPDDYYSYAERQLLQSLAATMCIALANIQQADSLRMLYQQDIDRQEETRGHLAREMHDVVLAEINDLFGLMQQSDRSAELSQRHQELNDNVRRLIYRLRPAMLDFGLYHALSELVDEMAARLGDAVQVSLMMPAGSVEYDDHVEEQVYRIVQQAAENAVQHGAPRTLSISGRLEPGRIDLLVEDDGAGFDLAGAGLPDLLRAGHYGLAGMSERAALIGAQLAFDSAPGQGARVRLRWQP